MGGCGCGCVDVGVHAPSSLVVLKGIIFFLNFNEMSEMSVKFIGHPVDP